eukprot:3135128-Prymnesium_polylepis.1
MDPDVEARLRKLQGEGACRALCASSRGVRVGTPYTHNPYTFGDRALSGTARKERVWARHSGGLRPAGERHGESGGGVRVFVCGSRSTRGCHALIC